MRWAAMAPQSARPRLFTVQGVRRCIGEPVDAFGFLITARGRFCSAGQALGFYVEPIGDRSVPVFRTILSHGGPSHIRARNGRTFRSLITRAGGFVIDRAGIAPVAVGSVGISATCYILQPGNGRRWSRPGQPSGPFWLGNILLHGRFRAWIVCVCLPVRRRSSHCTKALAARDGHEGLVAH